MIMSVCLQECISITIHSLWYTELLFIVEMAATHALEKHLCYYNDAQIMDLWLLAL